MTIGLIFFNYYSYLYSCFFPFSQELIIYCVIVVSWVCSQSQFPATGQPFTHGALPSGPGARERGSCALAGTRGAGMRAAAELSQTEPAFHSIFRVKMTEERFSLCCPEGVEDGLRGTVVCLHG